MEKLSCTRDTCKVCKKSDPLCCEEQMVPSFCMKYRSQRELLKKAVMLAQRTQSTQQQHVNSSPSSYWVKEGYDKGGRVV